MWGGGGIWEVCWGDVGFRIWEFRGIGVEFEFRQDVWDGDSGSVKRLCAWDA